MYVSLIFVFANFPDVEQSGYSRFFDRETIFLCSRNVGNQFYQFSPTTSPNCMGQKLKITTKLYEKHQHHQARSPTVS